MFKNGLMPKRDYDYPRCRDDINISCGNTFCEWNYSKKCSVPSLCVIGNDGKCEGYKLKDKIKNPKPLDGD